uniref:Ig-like domain-containing protein n=1 Tax=Parascaris equorum TaxID=6256 RepID=A0A914RBN5_PAREQ
MLWRNVSPEQFLKEQTWIAEFQYCYLSILHFDEFYGAKLIVRPESSTVPVDTRVSFFCRADGNPMPPVVWRRNGQAISDPR